VIEATHLTKRFGGKTAVDDLSFVVKPGIVTGFLGPNGAGKSTTMRMILGLDLPTAGSVTVNGKRYADHRDPLHQVGALLEARSYHTGRSARNHLLALAATHRIPRTRVDELIGMVGLDDVARRPTGGFSLGMGQRLGIAVALLGDPATLVLDEPVNGLDPEGIRWIRNLLKNLAAEGRTVFLSSHLMNEMAVTADHVIVIGRGALIADLTTRALVRSASGGSVRVQSPEAGRLRDSLTASGVTVSSTTAGVLEVRGMSPARIGELAREQGIAIHELVAQTATLEEAFMELTEDSVEYHGHAAVGKHDQGNGRTAVGGDSADSAREGGAT
jgi:ABC-2 type transport system ATP-binding protein